MKEKFKKAMLNVQKDGKGKVVAFDIDRRFWGQGKDSPSLLLGEEGKMCCLGFYARACGYGEAEIYDKNMPSDLRTKEQLDWLQDTMRVKTNAYSDTQENYLAQINDGNTKHYNSRAKREKRIAEIFAKNGIEVSFVN